jgi:hypothetical protein
MIGDEYVLNQRLVVQPEFFVALSTDRGQRGPATDRKHVFVRLTMLSGFTLLIKQGGRSDGFLL